MDNLKYFVLIALVSFLMFQCGTVKACTFGEKQTYTYNLAEKIFWKEANNKPEQFLWTKYEADKLYKKSYKQALLIIDKTCEVKK